MVDSAAGPGKESLPLGKRLAVGQVVEGYSRFSSCRDRSAVRVERETVPVSSTGNPTTFRPVATS